MSKKEFLFNLKTPLGFYVHCTQTYWNFIIQQKHPSLKNSIEAVMNAIQDPEVVRRSRKDPNVYLFYAGDHPKWICAVAKDESEKNGFLITAYHTDVIKSGEVIWTKSK